jgi:sugar O-acyltransferase (sialic acid O-acetyltransferase NeuD family)
MQKLIIIGAGGHCASCIDVIEQEGKFEILGIVDKNRASGDILGHKILGQDNCLPDLRSVCKNIFIAIGQIESPLTRIRIFDYVHKLGFNLPKIISPRAYISEYAVISDGVIIMHDALVNARAVIERNCIINSKSLIEHDAIIEMNCHVSTGAIVNGHSLVKKGTFIGSGAVVINSVQTKENDFIRAGSIFKGYGDV